MKKVNKEWGWIARLGHGKGWRATLVCLFKNKGFKPQRSLCNDKLWVLLESLEYKVVRKKEWHQVTNHSNKRMFLIEIQIGKKQ